jgi:antirestriction protein ArdC
MAKTFKTARHDVAEQVTQTNIQKLETGTLPWRCNWRKAGGSLPLRHNGEAYRGINLMILGITAAAAGYASPFWMTYRQAKEYGGQVRKGEKSTMVVYYGQSEKENADTGEKEAYRFLKSFSVFNADQIDDLPAKFHPVDTDLDAGGRPIDEFEAFFASLPVTVRIGGDVAAYRPISDDIIMPAHERFEDAEAFYATLAHETVHFTGGKGRLQRDCAEQYHSKIEARAEEELVAELGAAMLGMHIGLKSDHIEDHASYVAGWLKRLQNDKKFIFKAAAAAQLAVDWIMEKSGTKAESLAA